VGGYDGQSRVIAHDGLLYVVGRYDGSSNLSSVEVYDPALDTWTLLTAHMANGRSYAGVVVERMVLGAGRSVWSPETPDLWVGEGSLSVLQFLVGVIAHDGLLYVAGGDGGSSNLSSIEVNEPALDSWTLLDALMTNRQSYNGVAVINNPL
ncbi:hypothetical protein QYM36_000684, partial [Artemia franciscana]